MWLAVLEFLPEQEAVWGSQRVHKRVAHTALLALQTLDLSLLVLEKPVAPE